MTAMNLIVQAKARAAFLLTDTVVIRKRDGIVAGFTSKVIPVVIDRRTVAAVAVCGRLEVDFMKRQMGRARSLSDFLDRFPDMFRAAERAIVAQREGGSMAAVVAAFDASRGIPLGFGIANDNALFAPGHRPYDLKPLAQHITEFDPDNTTLRQTNFRDPEQWNPERDALTLIEAQRCDPMLDAPERYCIGGKAVLTCVDARGVSHVTLKRWPDRIGHLIDPYGPARPPGWRDLWARIREC